MMFSKSCQYALQAVIAIALKEENGKPVGVKQIAGPQEIPGQFLSKILQQLVRAKILDSTKGPNGGFSFRKSPDEITLFDIVKEVDGLDLFDECVMGLKECSDESPCPIHAESKLLKERIKNLLISKSVTELAKEVESGNAIITLKVIS